MRYYHNFQNDWKGKSCDHVFSILDEKYDYVIQKCIKCFKIEERVKGF